MGHRYKVVYKIGDSEVKRTIESPVYYIIQGGKALLADLFAYDMERQLGKAFKGATVWEKEVEILRVEYDGFTP